MDCVCDWIFDTDRTLIYGYKVNNQTYITHVGSDYKITTLLWNEWFYCNQCKAYVGANLNYRYPTVISLSIQNFVVNDVKLKILDYYHTIK